MFVEISPMEDGGETIVVRAKVVRVALEDHRDHADKPVAVYVMIDARTNIYDTDEFIIEQAGFIGDLYLNVRHLNPEEIVAKYGEPRTPQAVGAHAHLGGAGVVGLTEVTTKTQRLLEQAGETLEQIRQTFADKYTRDQIHEILLNINQATAKTNLIAERVLHLAGVLAQTAESGQPKIADTLDAVGQTAADLKATSAQIRQVVRLLAESTLPQQMALSVANIHHASENIRVTTEVVRDAVAGPEGTPRLAETMDNMAATSRNLERATADIAELVGEGEITADMKATLANLRAASQSLKAITARTEQFLIEEETLDDIEASLKNIRAMSEKGVRATEKAGQVLDRVDRTMDRLGSVARPFTPYRTAAYWDLEATEDVGLRGDFNLRLQYGEDPLDFWRFGIRDVGDKEKLTLQKSLRLGPQTWGQAGILKSKVGVGLSYQMTPDWTWQLEAYDPDNTQFDLRGIYQLGPEWYLTVGLADSFDQGQPFVGLRRWIKMKSGEKDEE